MPAIQECVLSSLARVDVHLRKSLAANIVLSGGASLMKGLPERLMAEIKDGLGELKVKMHTPQERA